MARVEPTQGPAEKSFIVQTGLTRRLIHAYDERGARAKFVAMLRGDGKYSRRFTVQPGDISIRVASEADVAEFAPRRRLPRIDGQEAWAFPDVPVVKKHQRSGDAS